MSLKILRQELYTIDLGNIPNPNIVGHELANHDTDIYRPCVVISTIGKLATIIPTSIKGGSHSTTVRVRAGTGNLNKDCYFLCHQIRTVSWDRLKKHIGRLPDEDFNNVLATLEAYLDI
jgi:mRNA-degrading endonuclease toxin of MazEF toxin-antitoxin module